VSLWIYIDFPNLDLESLISNSAKNTPKMLVTANGTRIQQCCQVARSYGVQPGMKLNTAYCLLPDVEVLTPNSEVAKQRLEQVALACYPMVSNIQIEHPEGLLLEVASMLKLFGNLSLFWSLLQELLGSQNLTHCCSTGHTPLVAKILAKANRGICSTEASLHNDAIDQLGVDDLGLPATQVKRLRSMGIRSCRQLRTLPGQELGYRFGHAILEFVERLQSDNSKIPAFQIPDHFRYYRELNYEAAYSKGLLFPIKTALQQFEGYLHARQLQSDLLYLRLNHRSGQHTEIAIRAAYGEWNAKHWLALVSIQLGPLVLAEPVIAYSLSCSHFNPRNTQVSDLLGAEGHTAESGHQLLAVLVSRLQSSGVYRLNASADHRPDIAGELVNALSTQDVNPKGIKPHPVFIAISKKPVDINRFQVLDGPERITTGWWHSDPFRGDFYSGLSTTGDLMWLARNDGGRWYRWGGYG